MKMRACQSGLSEKTKASHDDILLGTRNVIKTLILTSLRACSSEPHTGTSPPKLEFLFMNQEFLMKGKHSLEHVQKTALKAAHLCLASTWCLEL